MSFFGVLIAAFACWGVAHASEPWKNAYDRLEAGRADRAKVGRTYRVEPSELHPTQFTIGRSEVRTRRRWMLGLTESELRRYLKRKVARVVIGPGGTIWVIDGHHLAAAIDGMPDRQELLVRVVKNWSDLSIKEFRDKLVDQNLAWRFDENERGPLAPSTLPADFKSLRDDPFRSFVWRVKKAGGFRDIGEPFAEFRWARFFRRYFDPEELKGFHPSVVREAVRLAHTPAASRLPGYTPKELDCIPLLSKK